MTLVIHHIEDKELALEEIYRTLKKGGNCVIMTTSHYRAKRHILRYFPGVVAIDLKRIPTIPHLKSIMANTGFRDVHHHMLRYEEGPLPTDEYLERVRKKYISTLALLSEEQFRRGIKIFEKKVKEKYGKRMKRIVGFDFIVGRK
jgi:ubiquinone/menaquinone biosynthesis C-methylase UbiE